jgi:hypothetical protein
MHLTVAAGRLTDEDHQVVIWQVAGPLTQRTHLRTTQQHSMHQR